MKPAAREHDCVVPTTSFPPTADDLAARCRAHALALARRRSVNGEADEVAFGPWLAGELRRIFPGHSVWTIPCGDDDRRACVALLVRGDGRDTVLLTGHYDTVGTRDYGPLEPLAIDPEALLPALRRKLDAGAQTAAELRAKTDLAAGHYLPGRGLLDMKAGLAAGLAAAETFAAQPCRGNLLFIAVPDEEANSAGARAAAAAIPAIERDHAIDVVGAVNLDSIADDGDGSAGQSVALGTVGKLLPTAFVAGLPSHAGFPFAGINAAVIAAAIARAVEWSPDLVDPAPGGGTPPSLLLLKDGKEAYDVTTPATAFAAFNVLLVSRTPREIMERFEALCRKAADDVCADLRARAGGQAAVLDAAGSIPILRYAEIADDVRRSDPSACSALLREVSTRSTMPDRCRALTEGVWRLSGRSGPAIVTGFGSTPYLPTQLSDTARGQRLTEAARLAAREIAARFQTTISLVPTFAGISDMSFFGEADAAALDLVTANTPALADAASQRIAIANIPIVNAGPWGRDYHTPLERLETRYAFTVLPALLLAIVRRLLPSA